MDKLLSKEDLKNVEKESTGLLRDLIAPAVGGIGGLVAPDYLGVKELIDSIVTDVTKGTKLPKTLSKIEWGSFIAAGVYVGLGSVCAKFKFKGAVGALPIMLQWYAYASAARLAIDGLLASVKGGASNG